MTNLTLLHKVDSLHGSVSGLLAIMDMFESVGADLPTVQADKIQSPPGVHVLFNFGQVTPHQNLAYSFGQRPEGWNRRLHESLAYTKEEEVLPRILQSNQGKRKSIGCGSHRRWANENRTYKTRKSNLTSG